ncbi:MAG: NUDIX domain-containing protein [Candidatus Saccharimonadales bacterium]
MNFPDIHKLATTPVLDVVRLVSMKNGEVLLVRESDDPNWKLPGGKIHAAETIFQAVVREIDEELGYATQEADLLKYHPTTIPHSPNIRHIFLMRQLADNEIKPTEDVEEAKYFPANNLPETKFKEHITSAIQFVAGSK